MEDMGKSLKGKELGKGISQRKEDGLYVARFTNRFGKRQAISDKTYNGVQKKMREAVAAGDKAIKALKQQYFMKNVILSDKEPMEGYENSTDLYMHVTQDSLFKGLEQFGNARQVG